MACMETVCSSFSQKVQNLTQPKYHSTSKEKQQIINNKQYTAEILLINKKEGITHILSNWLMAKTFHFKKKHYTKMYVLYDFHYMKV